jgi:DNA-directed RNA polymerase specialized sigma24 family protein
VPKKQPENEHALPSLALVFGYIAVKELKLAEDRISVLARLGFGNAEIATICDTSLGVVRTLKSKSLKSLKKGKRK